MKAAGAGPAHPRLFKVIGLEVPVCVWTDWSAAIGISTRPGLGKLRHLETHTLWVQEKIGQGAIAVRKVRGDVNPTDLFTKHLPSKDKINPLIVFFGCEYRSGRAAGARQRSAELQRVRGRFPRRRDFAISTSPTTSGVHSQNWRRRRPNPISRTGAPVIPRDGGAQARNNQARSLGR